MCSSTISLGQYTPGWKLADFISDPKPTERCFKHYIGFTNPFTNVPLVHTGIIGFDIDNRDTGRVTTYIEDVSDTGFNLVIKTWMHSRVYQVDVSWLAIGLSI